MDKKEFDRLADQFHKQGLDNDEIMTALIDTYDKKECSLNEREIMTMWLGFELTEAFYKNKGIGRC